MTNNSMFEDFSNPYFLHHGESPGSILVSQPLNGENYYTSSRSMLTALNVKNKTGFVDGTFSQPQNQSDPLYILWFRCNNIVLSWILNSLTREIAANVISTSIAEEVWRNLKTRFTQGNGPSLFQLKKDLASLVQDQSSVSSYYTKLKAVWDEFSTVKPIPNCSCNPGCSCGALKTVIDQHQKEYVVQFLMGLNDSFTHIRGQILLMDPMPSIDRVLSLTLQEEKQRKVVGSPLMTETAALFSKNVNLPGTMIKNYQKQRPKPICTHCGLTGHTVDRCYKLHGYPPGYRQNPITKTSSVHQVSLSSTGFDEASMASDSTPHFPFTKEQCQQLLSFLQPSSTQPTTMNAMSNLLSVSNSLSLSGMINSPDFVSKQSNSWIIDSGATDHM
ncbi:hypothetical protein F2P56_033249, partial [Juglans regia]